jgi:hypothetical protein
MNQKRVYKSYPKEFKEEAVALVTIKVTRLLMRLSRSAFGPTNFTIGRLELKHRSRMIPYQLMSVSN